MNLQPRSENSQKSPKKQLIKSNERLYNTKCALLILMICIITLLIINTFNGNIKSTVMEMALVGIFYSYFVNKMKKCLSSHW